MKNKNKDISYVGLWMCLGGGLGLVYDNLVFGAAVGVAIGATLDGLKSKNKKDK